MTKRQIHANGYYDSHTGSNDKTPAQKPKYRNTIFFPMCRLHVVVVAIAVCMIVATSVGLQISTMRPTNVSI